MERTGVPLLGVVPYADIDLDDEDSLAERLQLKEGAGALRDVGQLLYLYLEFPRISFPDNLRNFFCPLCGRAEDLGEPDLIILPGTKTTMDDLRWLKGRGLAEKIRGFAAAGGQVFGLCEAIRCWKTLSDIPETTGAGRKRAWAFSIQKRFFLQKTLQSAGLFRGPCRWTGDVSATRFMRG